MSYGESSGHITDDVTTLKGQGRGPKCLGLISQKTVGDTDAVTMEYLQEMACA